MWSLRTALLTTALQTAATNMKGQLSMEYLIISVISLAVISISAFTLLKIKDMADNSYALITLKNDADAIYNAAEDACTMGYGNSRSITLNEAAGMRIWSNGNAIEFSKGNFHLSKNMTCSGEMDVLLGGKITIENQEGKISVGKIG